LATRTPYIGDLGFVRQALALPLGRRPEFSNKPTGRPRFHRIGCGDVDLNLIAFRAFEQTPFETNRPRRNAFQHHPRLSAGTARALDSAQEVFGRGHGASLLFRRERYGTHGHRWLPIAGSDRLTLPPHPADSVVNIAHSRKFNAKRLEPIYLSSETTVSQT
jgi:hypothetical protein